LDGGLNLRSYVYGQAKSINAGNLIARTNRQISQRKSM